MIEDKPEIHNPRDEPLQLFISDKIQLGEVIERLLQFTGKANVLIASFSVGEEFTRKIHALKKKGLIGRADLYIDMKAAEKTARTRTITTAVFDTVNYCANHAKAVVIEGTEQSCTVITSQTARAAQETRYITLQTRGLLRNMCEENFKTSQLFNLNDEFDFSLFERLVKALTPIADIAVLMDVDETALRDAIEDPNQEISKVFRRIRAQTTLEMRERNIEYMEAGSPSATERVAEYLKQAQLDL